MNIDFSNLKGSALVALFNALNPDTPVKKFSDREAALRRIAPSLVNLTEFTEDQKTQFTRAGIVVDILPGPMHQGGDRPTVELVDVAPTETAPEAETTAVSAEPESIAPAAEPNKPEEAPATVQVSSNGLAMMKSVAERTEPNKPSDVLLGDVELDLNLTVRKRAKRILDELIADGLLSLQKLATDDDQEVIIMTQTGVELCVAQGFVQASAYAAAAPKSKGKGAPKESKPPKTPKEPKQPKAPRDLSFTYHPNPKVTPHAVRAGSKVATIIDLISRPQGAAFAELQALMAPQSTVRGVLQYDVNALVGYGVTFDGQSVKIILPKGLTAPLAHREKVAKPAPAAKKAAVVEAKPAVAPAAKKTGKGKK